MLVSAEKNRERGAAPFQWRRSNSVTRKLGTAVLVVPCHFCFSAHFPRVFLMAGHMLRIPVSNPQFNLTEVLKMSSSLLQKNLTSPLLSGLLTIHLRVSLKTTNKQNLLIYNTVKMIFLLYQVNTLSKNYTIPIG